MLFKANEGFKFIQSIVNYVLLYLENTFEQQFVLNQDGLNHKNYLFEKIYLVKGFLIVWTYFRSINDSVK